MPYWQQFRWRLFRLSLDAVNFEQRGFRGANETSRERIERIGTTFLAGYHLALQSDGPLALARKLAEVDEELRGFAFEGAAMALALVDCFTPWQAGRLDKFIRGAGSAYVYMVHVGVGWQWARLPFGFRRRAVRLDPLLRWLAFDGWGFHEGFFHWRKYVGGQPVPTRLRDYERRAFDQGLGRSLWFVNGANVQLVAQTISGFPIERRADLWSGVGLAATYAGPAGADALRRLRHLSGAFRPHLAQGAAFAAKARQRAGNSTDATELACSILCATTATAAAGVSDLALENLPADAEEPAYEVWRQKIQRHFTLTDSLVRAC